MIKTFVSQSQYTTALSRVRTVVWRRYGVSLLGGAYLVYLDHDFIAINIDSQTSEHRMFSHAVERVRNDFMWLAIHVRTDPRRPAKTFNFGLMFQRAPFGSISTTSINIVYSIQSVQFGSSPSITAVALFARW